MINQTTVLWGGFILFVVVMLALDLGVFQRGKQVMSMKESLIWCGVWAGLAMLFNVGVFVFHPRGTEAGLEFFTGYVTEESLDRQHVRLSGALWLLQSAAPTSTKCCSEVCSAR